MSRNKKEEQKLVANLSRYLLRIVPTMFVENDRKIRKIGKSVILYKLRIEARDITSLAFFFLASVDR